MSSIDYQDSQEAFIKSRMALYLNRLLAQRQYLEDGDFNLAGWLLGDAAFKEFVVQAKETLGEDGQDLEPEYAARDLAFDLSRAIIMTKSAKRNGVLNRLRSAMDKLLAVSPNGEPCGLELNLKELGKRLKLSAKAMEVIFLFYLFEVERKAADFLSDSYDLQRSTGRRALATALDMGAGELQDVLDGELISLGVLRVRRPYEDRLYLSEFWLPFLSAEPGKPPRHRLYRPVKEEPLPLEAHQAPDGIVEHLGKLLTSPGERPVHVLLYGPPGTGKTSFARALIHSLNATGYEVLRDAAKGAGDHRSVILACLKLTEGGGVLLADEADAVLSTDAYRFRFGDDLDRGGVNQLLDEPGSRVIWIVNGVDELEGSVIRRFAFSLGFEALNPKQRRELWGRVLERHGLDQHFSQEAVRNLAAHHPVSAGALDTAAYQAGLVGGGSAENTRAALSLALTANETLAGKGLRPKARNGQRTPYNVEALNTAPGTAEILSRVRTWRELHENGEFEAGLLLLFHGPSGSGKSALAKHLAKELGLPVLERRASDLLSKYVGDNERAVAQAFRQAEAEGAVLIMDEVDSFLGDRRLARRTWEVSLVNELLAQLESFSGLLVATTNRADHLDAAGYRRFGERVQFGYLSAEGAETLYRLLLAPLAGGQLSLAARTRLRGLRELTPGDLVVVRDRYRLMPKERRVHAAMVGDLEREVSGGARTKVVAENKPVSFERAALN